MSQIFKKYISSLFSFFAIFLLIVGQSIAQEGRLMDPYPQNTKAQNFELLDISGDKQQLNGFRGKFVLVNFWALSCNVCKNEMLTLQSAYEILGQEKFEVLSIHAGADVKGTSEVVKLNEITYPVLLDTNLELGDWGIPFLPTTFLIDPDGKILYRAVGTRIWNSPHMIDFLQAKLDKYKPKAALKAS